uniref:Uncharacterized protein n=1 Tax=Myoviridae sp. ctfWc3 TaxID=2827697 RepID=A0A8S5SDG1_9CAUD|nr:MAG TPA: hypothetical protein [Myoviridae sp. ctfWc3]
MSETRPPPRRRKPVLINLQGHKAYFLSKKEN